MSILLYRIDERLIHGQVVIGWGHELRHDSIVVVDDDLADSEWEQELYRLAAGTAEVTFTSEAGARDQLPAWRSDGRRTVLLTRTVSAMAALADGGLLAGEEINLGGLHHTVGRTELLGYLHVSDEDRERLRALAAAGTVVSARDVPDAQRVSLATLLRE